MLPSTAYKSLQRADPSAIVLGMDGDGEPFRLPLRARQEHTFILGATGAGKSHGLIHFARQAKSNGEGLIFLDPHGNDTQSPFQRLLPMIEPAHVIDFNGSHVIGFNPLHRPEGTDTSVIVANVMDAFSAIREDENVALRPTIERVMTCILSVGVELGLTLPDLPRILDRKQITYRESLIPQIRDPFIKDTFRQLHDLSLSTRRERDFDQETVGPRNRLFRLLASPVLRTAFSQKNGLDVRTIMDSGGVILANLSGGTAVSKGAADLFGRLLVRTVLFEGERRQKRTPVNLIMDEAHRYFTGDIPVLLTEIRKYGISVVAAMQYLHQAEAYDENILAALLNSTNVKIIFRLRDMEEAERMAHSNIPLDLETPVRALIKPTVVDHVRTWMRQESESEQKSITLSASKTRGRTEAHGTMDAKHKMDATSIAEGETDLSTESESNVSGSGTVAGDATTSVPAGPGDLSDALGGAIDHWSTAAATTSASAISNAAKAIGRARGKAKNIAYVKSHVTGTTHAKTHSVAHSEAETEGEAHTKGTGKTEGKSEALEPVLALLPTAVHGKENVLYMAGKMLLSLPTGTAYLSYVGQQGPVSGLVLIPRLRFKLADVDEMRDRLIQSHPAAVAIATPQIDSPEEEEPSPPKPRKWRRT